MFGKEPLRFPQTTKKPSNHCEFGYQRPVTTVQTIQLAGRGLGWLKAASGGGHDASPPLPAPLVLSSLSKRL